MFATAFALEEYTAATEHGWISTSFLPPLCYYSSSKYSLHCKCTAAVIIRRLLTTNLINQLWNVFDFSLIIIFLSYFILRIKGLSDGNSTYLFCLTSCIFNGI